MTMRRWAVVQSRNASTKSTHPFPFPTSSSPTPHEIFHLSPGCTQKEIKARYYELARIYHPDSQHIKDLPDSLRHDRFGAVSKAYDILRGHSSAHQTPNGASFDQELARRARHSSYSNARAGRRWTGQTNEWGGFVYEYEEMDKNASNPKNERLSTVTYSIIAFLTLGLGGWGLFNDSPLAIARARHRQAERALENARNSRREVAQIRREWEAYPERVRRSSVISRESSYTPPDNSTSRGS